MLRKTDKLFWDKDLNIKLNKTKQRIIKMIKENK